MRAQEDMIHAIKLKQDILRKKYNKDVYINYSEPRKILTGRHSLLCEMLAKAKK